MNIRKSDDGAVAVEFALVLPLLLLLVFGAIQWGFVMAQNAGLSSGARAGARYGVVNILSPHTCQGVVDQARQGSGTVGLTGGKVAVTVKRGTTEASAVEVCKSAANSSAVSNAAVEPCKSTPPVDNNKLFVTARYLSPSLLPIGISEFDLAGTGAFRCEYK